MFEGLDQHDFSDVVSMLMAHGVNAIEAQRYVCSIVKADSGSESNPIGFYELYGQGGLTRAARRFKGMNIEGLQVLDLRGTRPDGENMEFPRKKERQGVLRLVREQMPRWIIGAPPCSRFPPKSR